MCVHHTIRSAIDVHSGVIANDAAMRFLIHFFCVFKGFIYLFLEREEGREEERERNIDVWLPLACPQMETQPVTQACALSGN